MPPRLPGSLRALVDAGRTLIRQSSSGRVALARAAAVVPSPTLAAAYAETATPMSDKRVRGALRRLDSFDAEPLAVRPASQVHAGELDGQPVAAKVRRPGLAAAVRADFALVDLVAGPLGAVFGAADIGLIVQEVREGALDELDLEHEGSSQRQAARVLRRLDGLRVPAVLTDATDEDVLVMECLDGRTLADGAVADDPEALARLLVDAHVAAWRDGGMILTDPRPGHVMLLRGGEVGLLGTGVWRPGDRERAQVVLDAARAVADDDADAFADAVAGRLALLDDAGARQALPLVREVLGPLAEGPARLDRRALEAILDRAFDRLPQLLALAARVTPLPADAAAARMLAQLAALLSHLGATHDWLRL